MTITWKRENVVSLVLIVNGYITVNILVRMQKLRQKPVNKLMK